MKTPKKKGPRIEPRGTSPSWMEEGRGTCRKNDEAKKTNNKNRELWEKSE